jgi:hypothetical protein
VGKRHLDWTLLDGSPHGLCFVSHVGQIKVIKRAFSVSPLPLLKKQIVSSFSWPPCTVLLLGLSSTACVLSCFLDLLFPLLLMLADLLMDILDHISFSGSGGEGGEVWSVLKFWHQYSHVVKLFGSRSFLANGRVNSLSKSLRMCWRCKAWILRQQQILEYLKIGFSSTIGQKAGRTKQLDNLSSTDSRFSLEQQIKNSALFPSRP